METRLALDAGRVNSPPLIGHENPAAMALPVLLDFPSADAITQSPAEVGHLGI